ncbi:High-affinity zinc uptake system membrane protein ZnuB [bioreactor metagenome]|uniref:High-affinity zinc uptake system membrane protein ZnuB n=1 Tax=bioreactor metagenome TaxID=1076179 RepID=A0A645HRX2_9ZZZZ
MLAVSPQDLIWLLLALVFGTAAWVLLYNRLLLVSVNASLARSRGIRVNLTEYAFVILVAVAVMLSIRWVGVLLINALLILPAAAGRNLARSARGHALFSVLIAMLSGVLGLILSFYWNTSAGAAIVLCAALFYGLSLLILYTRRSMDRKKQ